jgi:hypothetical protein
MAVKITNITDVKTPLRDKTMAQPKAVKVLNTVIAPGDTVKFDESFVRNPSFPSELHPQIKKLVDGGLICVGELSASYKAASRNQGYKGRTLSGAKLFSQAKVNKAPKHRTVKAISSVKAGKKAPQLNLTGKKRAELVKLAEDMGIGFTTQTSNKELIARITEHYDANVAKG